MLRLACIIVDEPGSVNVILLPAKVQWRALVVRVTMNLPVPQLQVIYIYICMKVDGRFPHFTC
jgi:hypothetical protein